MSTQPHLNKLRKDKFIFVLTLPPVLRKLNSKTARQQQLLNLDSLQFSLYDFAVPTITVPEHQIHYAGQNHNVTGYDRPPYPPLTLNFEVDNEYKNYWVIWKWLQLFNDPLNAMYGSKDMFPNGYPEQQPNLVVDYATTMYAYILDEYNNKKVKITYKHAFPTALGELQFSYRDAEQLQSSATIVYNQLDIDLLQPGEE